MDYAIGDIHGCYHQLMQLLEKIDFDEKLDRLWFTGDFVNRGPESLAVLRFISSLAIKPIITLGNHDLHFLAVYYKAKQAHPKFDAFAPILNAIDCDEIATWLCQQPLAYYDSNLDILMVHAGICPTWSIVQTCQYSQEVVTCLRDPNLRKTYLTEMYGNYPDTWQPALTDTERLRMITNYLTRTRYIEPHTHKLLFQHKTLTQDEQAIPWFHAIPPQQRSTILFGHWAALEGKVGREDIIGLDTACYYGGALTALCLQTKKITQVPGLNSSTSK